MQRGRVCFVKNIILIGYMGCGKSTVGQCLAKMLDFTFVDADAFIETQQQRTISDIFAIEGEEKFRQLETDLLKQLVKEGREQLVIATGGGMPLRNENRELLSKLGMVVYLKASPETIYDRVKNDTQRPLLQCDNPFAKIQEMIVQRAPVYQETAEHIVMVDTLAQEVVAEHILGIFQDNISKSRQRNGY